MTTIDTFIRRNHEIAAHHLQATTLPSLTLQTTLNRMRACIIGCADPRADPVHVLGIEPLEAVTLRNIGGRVVPETFEELGLLSRIAEHTQGIPGSSVGEFHLIVLHHSDCGIIRLQQDPELVARYFEIDQSQVPAKEVSDPRASLEIDVAALRMMPSIPSHWLVSGLFLDIATGITEVVIPPAPIR